MNTLHDILHRYVDRGTVPGAVALVARGDDVEVVAVGSVDTDGTAPMTRDSIFRIASITKPIVAAAVLMLIEDGVLALDAPVEEWLPELAKPSVVRTPSAPVEDVVPAARPITVEDLLSFRTGWGFPSDFSLPAVQSLFTVQKDGRSLKSWPEADTWLGLLARVPMLYQPGEAWLYATSSDLQGILIARASGRSLPDFLAERIFEPLGMKDTAFSVATDKVDRFAANYQRGPDKKLKLIDDPFGSDFTKEPGFKSGGGGLTGTSADYMRFCEMLRRGGELDGARVLGPRTIELMHMNHLPENKDLTQLALGTFSETANEGVGFGLGFASTLGQVQTGTLGAGDYYWGGAASTIFWVDPKEDLSVVFMTQLMPSGTFNFRGQLKSIIYASIID
jgi:CubicO group peptidase (beta-lactamase class C family)